MASNVVTVGVERDATYFQVAQEQPPQPSSHGTATASPWQLHMYVLPVLFTPEPEGGFSAESIYLPGAVSEGDDLQQARSNIVDAIQQLILSYRDQGEAVPLERSPIRNEAGKLVEWVAVYVG